MTTWFGRASRNREDTMATSVVLQKVYKKYGELQVVHGIDPGRHQHGGGGGRPGYRELVQMPVERPIRRVEPLAQGVDQLRQRRRNGASCRLTCARFASAPSGAWPSRPCRFTHRLAELFRRTRPITSPAADTQGGPLDVCPWPSGRRFERGQFGPAAFATYRQGAGPAIAAQGYRGNGLRQGSRKCWNGEHEPPKPTASRSSSFPRQ